MRLSKIFESQIKNIKDLLKNIKMNDYCYNQRNIGNSTEKFSCCCIINLFLNLKLKKLNHNNYSLDLGCF